MRKLQPGSFCNISGVTELQVRSHSTSTRQGRPLFFEARKPPCSCVSVHPGLPGLCLRHGVNFMNRFIWMFQFSYWGSLSECDGQKMCPQIIRYLSFQKMESRSLLAHLFLIDAGLKTLSNWTKFGRTDTLITKSCFSLLLSLDHWLRKEEATVLCKHSNSSPETPL